MCCVIGVAMLKVARRAAIPLPMDRCTDRRFDRTAWRDSALVYSKHAVRGCMVDDLLRKTTLVGMSRDEIVEVLGVPPATMYFKDYDLVYWLGPERSLMSIDSEWLVIRLDGRSKVSEATVVTD